MCCQFVKKVTPFCEKHISSSAYIFTGSRNWPLWPTGKSFASHAGDQDSIADAGDVLFCLFVCFRKRNRKVCNSE